MAENLNPLRQDHTTVHIFAEMFYLPFDIPRLPVRINLKDPVVSIGSCFSEHIGQKLITYKFTALSNPFGTIYNPLSIFTTIKYALKGQFDEEGIINREGVYYHWDTHSELSALDHDVLKDLLVRRLKETKAALQNARWLILSPGTSIAYRHVKGNRLVANCHKVPQKEFRKHMLSSKEIIDDYFEMLSLLKEFNPRVQVILTISPVRHVKEGLVENNISKGILLQTVGEITSENQDSFYFPSYELMIDVLRDYRFYKEDLVHPNEQAVHYIWERFVDSNMDEETKEFIREWEKIRRSLLHRPFHPTSEKHQKFIRSLMDKLNRFRDKIDLSSELKQIENQLIK